VYCLYRIPSGNRAFLRWTSEIRANVPAGKPCEVDRFLLGYIESVPHLEALLLLVSAAPKPWTPEEVAGHLYLDPGVAHSILEDLARRNLIVRSRRDPMVYLYQSGDRQRDELMAVVNATYRAEMVRVATLIHTKALVRPGRAREGHRSGKS
jgi:hypothetical protein